MGYSPRTFLIAADDSICRLSKRYWQMLGQPDSHRLPAFAGQRVRIANLLVQLVNRVPTRGVYRDFMIVTFDADGALDIEQIMERMAAHGDVTLSGGSRNGRDTKIVDATARFKVQGGQWTPSPVLATALEEAALGLRPCPRI
ncbi:hypothetical protein WS70_08600 [Burkholderia mayonis]|uniref:Uncharacterized protein n=1 Tax=Burkholderia mayonis TaxID=1385591 RepID=A0A1B4FDZ1_9BURK|nr:hypothetical protein [Burkholderia mayonis]AOJ01881.1 hypothetical protein WS70_08600 [Burkholderia mayonis]KVE47258.1 hypothetical protein WS70_25820 [Burkholderia mayonis]